MLGSFEAALVADSPCRHLYQHKYEKELGFLCGVIGIDNQQGEAILALAVLKQASASLLLFEVQKYGGEVIGREADCIR